MRIVSWNIRAGGGRRWEAIAACIAAWRPDLAVLSEFRATAPSRSIAAALAAAGLAEQRASADPAAPARNALLVASRWPLRRLCLRRAPADPLRWLPVDVRAPRPFAVLAVHVPNRDSGRKYPFLDAVHAILANWRGKPALLVGDTNSGRIGIDEESPAFSATEDGWIRALETLGWRDAYRAIHPDRREFTWYSPNGDNGFRLDQGFVGPRFSPELREVRQHWAGGPRRDAVSDHAALVLDFGRRRRSRGES